MFKAIEDIPLDNTLEKKYYTALKLRKLALVVSGVATFAFLWFIFSYDANMVDFLVASVLYSTSLVIYVASEFNLRQIHYLFSLHLEIKMFEALEESSEEGV